MLSIKLNKGGNWTLPGILGFAGVLFIIVPLLSDLSKGFIVLGVIFLALAFAANQ